MEWWVWLIGVVGVYLVLCLVPWLLLLVISALLGRKGTFVDRVLPRINQLVDAERTQTGLWPESPRSGRYDSIDRAALELLTGLRARLLQIDQQADTVAAYAPVPLSVVRLFTFGAWPRLISASRAWADRRRLDNYLVGAEAASTALLEQQSLAEAVPDRIEADLGEVRAEVRRLYVLWEAEVQAGTREIQALGDGLALVDNALGSAAEAVAVANNDVATIQRADQQLAMATETVRQSEQELTTMRDNRSSAQEAVQRSQVSVNEALGRWEQLRSKGARDPSLADRVGELTQQMAELDSTFQATSPSAYAQAVAHGSDVMALGSTVIGELQALEDAMTRSAEAASANAGLLEQVRTALAECSAEEPALTFDEGASAVAEAQEVMTQAETLLSQGTWHGYQTAATLSSQAQDTLHVALGGITKTHEAMQTLSAQREQVSAAARASLREGAAALAVDWAVYGRHWHPLRQEAYAEAVRHLDAADAAWNALPEDYLTAGAIEQSRVPVLQAGLQAVTDEFNLARMGLETLSAELRHIVSLREQLEAGIAVLEHDTLPAMVERRGTMLPELLERADTWLAEYQAERASLNDPAEIDYERATGQWLPSASSDATGILAAYDGDLVHYGKLLADATRRLDRTWQRLQRLDPTQKPLPQEDVEQLSADYEAWQAVAETEADNPAVLSTLVTHQAGELERRFDAARRQITEGRQSLSSLERQFEQLGQSLQKMRASLRSLEQDSQWQQIDWVLGSGEETWERAMAAQASSRESDALDMAVNELRRALNVGQEAQQIYAGTEQQLRSALERLNREFRTATTELDRAQRRAGQLRQQGPSDELDALDEHIASAMSLVSMAQNAGTFEDALRHLLESQAELGRA